MSLGTTYLGLPLKNPLIASASPLGAELDKLRRLEDAGAAAIVLPSLFQEQVEYQYMANEARTLAYADGPAGTVAGTMAGTLAGTVAGTVAGTLAGTLAGAPGGATTCFAADAAGPYGLMPERYLDLVRRGTEAVSIPVIASLNGSSRAGWFDYARLVEQAGAVAVELNMYHVPTDLMETGRNIEARYMEIVAAVCCSVAIPVSVKLTPYLSSIGHFATTLVGGGARGLVLFNRLLEPDIDLVAMSLTDRVELSTPAELRLPLLWTAILAGRTPASIATSSGVATTDEVVKCILAGADAVMTTSALLRHGMGALTELVAGLQAWMDERGIEDLGAMRGLMSWERSKDRSVYTRANYLRVLERYAAA